MSESKDASKYDVCFVQANNSNEPTENLKRAFEAMDSNQLEPTWITAEEGFQVSRREPKLYIIDPFEGEVFEHLKTVNCRLVGPLCILYCLQHGDILPKRPNPVYSVSMRKITVSCSNISNDLREDLCHKIELMGGFFSKDLTKSVSHLIVGEVGSKKYRVAANFGLSIMTPEWVNDVWENGQYQQIHATNSSYSKYKCPVFKGLVVTVSQLSVDERSTVQSLIEQNGGSYLAPLKANKTTHLVLTEPVGDKYRYAKNWKIYCVNVNWIYDSLKSGYCKDENLYKIDDLSQPKRSTPNRDLTCSELPLVDCSVITNISTVTHLDETVRSETSIACRKGSWAPALESFDLSSLPKYGQFLDGCKIFLTGFSSIHLDKLRKIVNAGGGMRFNMYSESVTHVVCGDLNDEFLQTYNSCPVKPFVVSINWLLECCKTKILLDEKPFLCMESSLLTPEKEIPEIKSNNMSQTSKPQLKTEDVPCQNLTDIFRQYVREECDSNNQDKNSNNSSVAKQFVGDNKEEPGAQAKSNSEETNIDNQEVDVIDLADDDPTSSSMQLFAGLKFVVVGFGEKDTEILAKMIEDHSGCVFSNDITFCKADIAIVPILWNDYITHAANIVTNCWLQKCIEESRIYEFDENELFKPIVIPPGKKPFESFVISVSQYTGTERDCLMHLAEVLGATCQEYFVRKANRSRGILSNTHLVVATPEGSKYEASKKWKIPAVTKQWVLDAATSGSVPPVNEYLVDACKPLQSNTDISNKISLTDKEIEKENINHIDIKQVNAECNVAQTRQSLSKSRRSSEVIVVKEDLNRTDIQQINMELPPLSKSLRDSKVNADCKRTNVDDLNLSHLNKELDLEFAKPFNHTSTSTPQRSVMELHNENKKELESPMLSKTETTFNESLNLDQSYRYKFQVSGLLKDLDNSASQEHSITTSAKRKSLPIEELFGRNLASALRGVNNKMLLPHVGKLDFDKSNLSDICPKTSDTSDVMKGVILCVAKKLANIQNELNEIVISMGGEYLWSYDSSCTHFVFTGKANDLSKEFREARSQGKKIVCPEWLYACREQDAIVEENLYPHTLKLNMSLTGEIAIVKSATMENGVAVSDKEQPTETTAAAPANINVADFNQQLNDLLVAAKSAKRRQSRRTLNSVSSSPSSEVSPLHKLQQKHIPHPLIKPVQQEENGTEEQDTGSQSQSYPVVWDDPTGRQEREIVAALWCSNGAQENIQTTKPSTSAGSSKRSSTNASLTMLSNDNNFDEVFIGPKKTNTDIQEKTRVRKFMFTNIPDPKKIKFIEIIKELGGEVSDEKAFDITCTHLILEKPIKNEKLLSSVASGKWVLHSQYLTACESQKKFIPEEDFEWGGPCTCEFMASFPNNMKKIANSPFRWRVKLNGQTEIKGAFHNWIVLVIADDKTKQSTYTKILEAGGGEVVPSEAGIQNLERLSHVIVDMKKRSLSQIDLSPYVNNKVKCVRPEYLAFYLIEDPEPDIENFIIPEAKNLSEQTSKRRTLSISTRGSKKSRLE
ncbi:DNA topoisomerase 2-binding protein 1-A [Caerostris darwini]|uniref:DNA topoisomerase 2-binding protein 1-A n=1 Tax=Caerostris darwini TaxID=1538125 RepID=A0AAV4PZI3_9ARAC|nr:DNA topoisomerase 2-binding protein 1-A [Caerostris darwini]